MKIGSKVTVTDDIEMQFVDMVGIVIDISPGVHQVPDFYSVKFEEYDRPWFLPVTALKEVQ